MQRLSMALCPACEKENGDEARFCGACGSPLVMRCPACDTINVRTRLVCHRCRAALQPEEGMADGTGDDEPVAPVVPLLLPDGDTPATEPGWTLSLRHGALLTPPPAPALVGDAARWPADPDAPRDPAPDWPELPPELPVPPVPPPLTEVRPARPAPVAAPQPKPAPAADAGASAARSQAKAERRAKVRQRQLQGRHVPADGATAVDVLLLEPDPVSRAAVCGVLEAFGFRPHLAVSAGEALGMSQRRPYAAVLLGLGADPGAAAALCQRLRQIPALSTSAMFAIGDAQRHTDRVRMRLAGADETLLRPVGRGALARALEGHGVTLPSDPRLRRPPAA